MAHLLDERGRSFAEELGHLPLALSHATAYMINQQIGAQRTWNCTRKAEAARRADDRRPRRPRPTARWPQPTYHSHPAARTGRRRYLRTGRVGLASDHPGRRPRPGRAPEALWANNAVPSYLTRTGPAPQPRPEQAGLRIRFRRRRNNPAHPHWNAIPVTAAQARAAFMLLNRYGLATYDAKSRHRDPVCTR